MKILRMWPQRLIVRLAVSFSLLIIVATAALTYHAAHIEAENINRELKSQALILADSLAASIASYVVTRDYTSIEAILLRAAQLENITRIQVADAEGKVLGDISKIAGGEAKASYTSASLTLPSLKTNQLLSDSEGIVVWQPIQLGDIIGWLRVNYSLERITAAQQRIWYNNTQDGALLVLLSLLMLILILRKPLRSIEKYTDFAESLDDYSGKIILVNGSSRELNKLGNALNRASVNLKAQNAALNKVLVQFEQVAAIAEYSPDIILSTNRKGDILYLNSRAKAVLVEMGFDEYAARTLFPHEFSSICQQAFEQDKAVSHIESSILERSFDWKFSPFFEQAVLHCHAVEITAQKKTQKALQDSETRYQTLFDSATDVILFIKNDRFVDFNRQTTMLFGCSENDLRCTLVSNFLPDSQPGGRNSESNLASYIRLAEQGVPQFFEWQFKRMDGTLFDTEVSLNVTRIDKESIILAIVRDITQRKLAEAKLIRQANFDTLTGLPNRILAVDRLNESIKRARRNNTYISVLFVNVDRFKSVNDAVGHSVGDEIIIEVARRLKRCVREGDTTARFGGDEFIIILNDIRSIFKAETVAEKVLAAMNASFLLAGQEFFLGASIGISGYPADGKNAQILLRNADSAMCKAKEAGRKTFQFYAPEFNKQAKARVQMEALLRKAVERDELFLTYQPQINIQNGTIVGAEALIRWQSPELGLVQPDQFIKLAEDTGLIIPIGEWVIRTACQAARAWQDELGLFLRISVNVSQRQFSRTELITQVSKILRETALSPELLELEITESLLMDDSEKTLDMIHAFKQLGLTLALDDFGTGYSSLSYLKRFPFDVLKIDRSFINDIHRGKDETGLCVAILAIASSFNMSVVAEGVENEDQLAFLRNSRTDIAQGYYFSKPLPDNEFRSYVKRYLLEHKDFTPVDSEKWNTRLVPS
ncbi:diguanylate cyclase/phosphodiesterase (GGDEF & EAL domains) with PAS/PAC sensor(s) [hydrothermal vent metagenome]|uniref:Diguanylate cyclase/phosphodiesterase (GGDEF & EAL domains) with PAS/PAC sensor(S) n=1 Tax=hydrothermal vent metagenome TaxID=652676 RepID=A0A3B0Z1D4_9ZZZZ